MGGRPLKTALFFLVLFSGLGMFGCKSFGIFSMGSETKNIQEANQAFLQGNYPLAREKYTRLSQQADNPDTMTSGRYGIACVEMITASNRAGFLKAFGVLIKAPANEFHGQPPELLIQAFSHGIGLMEAAEREKSAMIASLGVREEKQKIERRKMQHLIKTLQHQISALESIDQELQEKRKNQ